MIYIYILLTIILSLLGAVFYALFLRRLLSYQERKWSIIAIVALSLSLPLFVPQLPQIEQALEAKPRFDYEQYKGWNIVDISDPKLTLCYAQATTSKAICQCEIVQKAELIQYEPNPYYDVALICANIGYYIFWAIFGFFLLFTGFNWAVLWLFAHRQRANRQAINILNRRVWLLYPSEPLPVSAFSLWHNYLIWSQRLDALSPEKQATIQLHEYAHLHQKDTWIQLFWQFLRAFWWCNPAFYYLRREWQQLCEFVADQYALAATDSPKKYAQLLFELKTQSDAPCFAHALASRKNKSLFYQRVKAILHPPKNTTAHPALWLFRPFFWTLLLTIFWQNSCFILPKLQEQQLAIQEYSLLQKQNQPTVLQYFCPDCLKIR
jgi:hypothetical protein